ncbi:MAG: MarR family transcriptional regulator [Selenomonadaceae bacterium]|nr:MarR family transcriptional regulator [Selenomonadaceae bacterium]
MSKAKITTRKIAKQLSHLSEAFRQAFSKQSQARCKEAAPTFMHLTLTQLYYIHAIASKPSITSSDLSKIFDVQRPTVTNIVSRLCKAGLVEKVQCETDRRVYHLSLTENGKHIMAAQDYTCKQIAATAEKIFTPEELDTFYEYNDRLLRNL